MNIEDLKTEGESLLIGGGKAPPAARNYQEPSAPKYEPMDTWEDLMSYGVTRKVVNGVEVEVETIPEVILVEKTLPMSTAFSDVKIQVNGRRFRKESCPRTLVCHDCDANHCKQDKYCDDDRYVLGTNNAKNYYFRHWLQTDIFCYFAHHFVTIPPLGWINAAHKHGVQCLGTFITDGAKGEQLCKELLRDPESRKKAVKKLCMVAEHYGFDGYLLNFENHIDDGQAGEYGKKKSQEMIEFVRLLHKNIKFVNPNAAVIWYDCIGLHGFPNYQNELNENNKRFFDACDGIFLNYEWNEIQLLRSVQNADDRVLDVFVGVDVFGDIRTKRGIGGLRTHEVVKMVADSGLSVAFFAPGWTFQNYDQVRKEDNKNAKMQEVSAPGWTPDNFSFTDFTRVDNELWMNCAKYLYFRTLKVSEDANETEVDGGVLPVPQCGDYQVIFSTDFSLGLGQRKFLCGTTEGCPWFNLNKQSFQPALNCFRSTDVDFNTCAKFEQERGFLGGVSLSIPKTNKDAIEYLSPVWIPLDVSLREALRNYAGTKCAAIVMVAWKKNDSEDSEIDDLTASDPPLHILLEFMQPSLSSRKVIRLSNYVSEQIGSELPKNPVTIQLKRFITQSQLCNQGDSIPDVNLVFHNAPYAKEDVNGWKISCFMMDVNHCIDWKFTAVRLGAQRAINVGLLSLALLSY